MLRNAKKILIINLRYIGDTVWLHPFIKNLKLNLPGAEISALINEGGERLLELMPELKEVIAFKRREMKALGGFIKFLKFLKEIRRKNFDAVFILTLNSDRSAIIGFASGAKIRIGFRSGSRWRELLFSDRLTWDEEERPHLIECYLQALTDAGLKIYDKNLNIDVPESVIDRIAKRFSISDTRDKKSIIVHPGARTELRQWGVANFAEVINSLADDYDIFLIGGPQEKEVVLRLLNKLNKAPDIVSTDIDLIEFAALCRQSDLFIGNDSAPIHIAAATGLPVIGIYGPTLSKHCGPWTDKRFLFDISMLPCRPCRQDRCINQKIKACINIITPEMVIPKIKEMLGR